MKKATSIVKGSLRLVSLVITIVTVATLATIGFSAYQEFNVLASTESSQNLRIQSTVQGGALHLIVAGKIPNNGLYPLDFSIFLSAKSRSSVLAESTSQAVRILPNEVKRFNISLDVNPYSISNKTELSALLTNGSQVILSTGIRASIEPFASIKVSGGSNLTLLPLMGDLRVGPGQVLHTTNGTFLAVPVSFVDRAGFSFPFNLHATVFDSQGKVAATGTTFAGLAVSGNETTLRLNFAITGQKIIAGGYTIELEVTIGQVTFPVRANFQVRA